MNNKDSDISSSRLLLLGVGGRQTAAGASRVVDQFRTAGRPDFQRRRWQYWRQVLDGDTGGDLRSVRIQCSAIQRLPASALPPPEVVCDEDATPKLARECIGPKPCGASRSSW